MSPTTIRDFLGFVVNPPPGDPSLTAGSDQTGPSTLTGPAGSSNQFPYILVAPPSGDTTGATDAAAITTATTALAAQGGHGTILFGNGVYYDNQQRDFHGTISVTLLGCGGISAGAVPGTNLRYVGTASPYLNARSSKGFQIRDVMVAASNPGFTGTLVDLSHDPVIQTDSAYWEFERCYLGVVDTSAAVVLYFDDAICGTVRACYIGNGNYGIQAIAVASHYSSGVVVENCTFVGQGAAGACISGPGEGWVIAANVFELLNGNAVIAQGPAPSNQYGVQISGNWIGDLLQAAGPTIITIGAAYLVAGNYIGGSPTSTAIALTANSHESVIQGNRLDTHSVGVALNPSAMEPFYVPNSYNNVTTRYTAPTIAVGAGAGTGASASIGGASSDMLGQFSVVSGTSTAAGLIATITLPSFHQGIRMQITPVNAPAAAQQAYVVGTTNNSFTVSTIAAIAAGGTTYTWNYAMFPVL